jgi:hypothetical protein
MNTNTLERAQQLLTAFDAVVSRDDTRTVALRNAIQSGSETLLTAAVQYAESTFTGRERGLAAMHRQLKAESAAAGLPSYWSWLDVVEGCPSLPSDARAFLQEPGRIHVGGGFLLPPRSALGDKIGVRIMAKGSLPAIGIVEHAIRSVAPVPYNRSIEDAALAAAAEQSPPPRKGG